MPEVSMIVIIIAACIRYLKCFKFKSSYEHFTNICLHGPIAIRERERERERETERVISLAV